MVDGFLAEVLQLVTRIEVNQESELDCNDDDSELMDEEEMYIEEEFWEN